MGDCHFKLWCSKTTRWGVGVAAGGGARAATAANRRRTAEACGGACSRRHGPSASLGAARLAQRCTCTLFALILRLLS
jgi:hypothetical protein